MPEIPTHHEPHRDLDELLEAFLDGDLSPMEQRRIARQAEQSPDVARRLAAARRIRDGLRALPRQSCPRTVEAQALAYAEARATSLPHRLRGHLTRLWTAPRLLQAVGAAAALVLILTVGLQNDGLHRAPAELEPDPGRTAVASEGLDAQGLSPEDVAAAERDVKLALAYLGKLGRTAGGSVRASLGAPKTSSQAVPE